MPYGKAISTLEERLDWLRDHPELWRHVKLVPLYGGAKNVFLLEADHRRIAQAMKKAGLFAATTYALDIPVQKYVRTLRALPQWK